MRLANSNTAIGRAVSVELSNSSSLGGSCHLAPMLGTALLNPCVTVYSGRILYGKELTSSSGLVPL